MTPAVELEVEFIEKFKYLVPMLQSNAFATPSLGGEFEIEGANELGFK